jgi:outer membrane receptor for ferrienterochelin and colicins
MKTRPLLLVLWLIFSPVSGYGSEFGSAEEILFLDIPSVFTASKYEQKITAAPSAVSVVTDSEIRKYGYRTLADVLRSVRSFNTSYDRQTEYLSVRGFGRPGDFNTRVLLLVNGIRLNNNIFDVAAIGTDFPLDIDLIERIEIVRGPGSSLYGSNAFFAVINVITRRGRDLQGVELTSEAGSYEAYRSRISYGQRFPGGMELLLSGSLLDREGHNRLYFPEFDSPATNNGIAEHVNSEENYKFFGSFTLQDFTLEAAYGYLDRQNPTGSFFTVFNDPRNGSDGRNGFINLQYQHLYTGQLEVQGRVVYSHFRGTGDYVYDYGIPGSPMLVVNKDEFRGDWWGGELQVSKLLFDRHHLVVGGEYRDNFRQDLKNSDLAVYLDSRQDSTNLGLFIQDDIQVRDKLALSLGIRYDRFSTFGGTVNPRLALIYNPWEKTTCKLLYGEAFRAPSAFENYYHDGLATQKPNPDLDPERIKTYELVWEQYLGEHLRGVATGYYYEIKDLINLNLDPADGLLFFDNLEEVKAQGLELELEGRLAAGWEGRLSYTNQRVQDKQTGALLTNSPRHLAKLNLVAPLWREKLFLDLEEQYTSRRKTLSGTSTGGFAITNLTLLGHQLLPGLEFSASIYNIFDNNYADPVSAAHLQTSIAQDGRTYRCKLSYSF